MVQPQKPPMSIRLKPGLLAEVEAYAKAHGLTMHAAVVSLIDLGLATPMRVQRLPPTVAQWPGGALIEPHHVEDPAPKLTVGSSVTFGPRRYKPGERSKKPKSK